MINPKSFPKQLDKSKTNLINARAEAAEQGIDTAAKLEEVHTKFWAHSHFTAHDWQISVTEALRLKLDCVVIAGTGSGKTIPFMMPLLADPSCKAIIVSPLKVLQDDQVYWFKKMNISVVAVNSET